MALKELNDTVVQETISKIFSIMEYEDDSSFRFEESENLYIKKEGKSVIIGGKEKTDISRALMLYITECRSGKEAFEICQKRHFDKLSFFIDLSRNGVVKVSKMKEIINCLALLGFNGIQLYMEDVFDLPGYPHFGYRRGKYSHDELREIDDYAYSMGIEAVPSIQALGHLEQYVRYLEAAEFTENARVLLCEEEKTYEFIEAIIRTLRDCFRTDKININCDEAAGVGVKQIMREKKFTSPYSIVRNHLDRVSGICEKYGFTTVVDGDLYYGHLGKGYYDFEFNPSYEDIENIPQLDILYWDYYHTEYKDYETLLKGHLLLKRNVRFMGGIWTWAGQLPHAEFTFDTMKPALCCCLDYGIKDVTAAIFGDDGTETNIAFALPQLLIFSEYCFHGKEYSDEIVYELSEKLFRLDMKYLKALSAYHYPWLENFSVADYIFPNFMGKKILYSDVLYNMTGTYDFSAITPKHKEALKTVRDAGKGTIWEKYFDYARLIFEITTVKTELLGNMRIAYESRDYEWIGKAVEETIPYLMSHYEKLMLLHEEQWMGMYKPFGWEEISNRYCSTIGRLHYAKRVLKRFINGEQEEIPELMYEYIEENDPFSYKGICKYKDVKSTSLF